MSTHYILTLLAAFAIFGFAGQSAVAAPKPNPKAYSGTYKVSGYTIGATNTKKVTWSYSGDITFNAKGKVSGKLSRYQSIVTASGKKDKMSNVRVSGKISRVTRGLHLGQPVYLAKTNIKFSDGTRGTVSIIYAYNNSAAPVSGYDAIKFKKMRGNISLIKR